MQYKGRYEGALHPGIIIVGAGPTGLSLACDLYRRGVECRVVDRARMRSAESRATDIHARTLEIFRALGVARRVIARGKKVRRFRAYSSGRLVADLSLDILSSAYPYAIALPQSDTEALLEARLEELGGTVERGVEVRDIVPGRDHVTVTLEHGDGRTESARCAWLVGCDGVHSTVRERLGIRFRGVTYREHYLVVDADLEWDLEHDQVHLFAERGGFINVLALPESATRVRILANLPERHYPSHLAAMTELFGARARVPARIVDPTFASTFRISRRLASRYRMGRTILAGDAAHTCSPLLGQGMNVGIQDAYNLGWKLALVVRGQADAALLESYERERRPIGRSVLGHTHLLHRISTTRSGVLAALRDLCTVNLHDLPGVRRLAAYTCSELATHYQGSPIVSGIRASLGGRWQRPGSLHLRGLAPVDRLAPIPGDRVPDVPLCGAPERRLIDLLGTGQTLLCFHGRSGGARDPGLDRGLMALADGARQRYGERIALRHVMAMDADADADADADCESSHAEASEVRDCSALLHRTFRIDVPTVCVIRPDGHIGFRADRAPWPGLFPHLDRLFGSRAPGTC